MSARGRTDPTGRGLCPFGRTVRRDRRGARRAVPCAHPDLPRTPPGGPAAHRGRTATFPAHRGAAVGDGDPATCLSSHATHASKRARQPGYTAGRSGAWEVAAARRRPAQEHPRPRVGWTRPAGTAPHYELAQSHAACTRLASEPTPAPSTDWAAPIERERLRMALDGVPSGRAASVRQMPPTVARSSAPGLHHNRWGKSRGRSLG